MGKALRSRGLLNKTVHPSVVALLFLLVTVGSLVGIRRLETDIAAHYDEINQVAETQPRFPRPGTIAGVRSDSSVDEQVPTQPVEEVPNSPADAPPVTTTSPTPPPERPSSQGTQELNRENPRPAEPAREPTPAPSGPLLCVIGICL